MDNLSFLRLYESWQQNKLIYYQNKTSIPQCKNFHKYVKINITKKRSNSKEKSNEKSNGSIHYGRCQNTTDLQLSILQDQDPSNYYSFREDKNANTRRLANDICQQELKNAVCMTLLEKCVWGKKYSRKDKIMKKFKKNLKKIICNISMYYIINILNICKYKCSRK